MIDNYCHNSSEERANSSDKMTQGRWQPSSMALQRRVCKSQVPGHGFCIKKMVFSFAFGGCKDKNLSIFNKIIHGQIL
jgi:hypothetical protein